MKKILAQFVSIKNHPRKNATIETPRDAFHEEWDGARKFREIETLGVSVTRDWRKLVRENDEQNIQNTTAEVAKENRRRQFSLKYIARRYP